MGEGWDRDSRRPTLYDICHNIIRLHNINQAIEPFQIHVRGPKINTLLAALCSIATFDSRTTHTCLDAYKPPVCEY